METNPHAVNTLFGVNLDTRLTHEIIHEIFVEGKDYSAKGLAFFLGKHDSAIYKMADGSRLVSADTARRIITFLHLQNPKETRLVDFFCSAAGFMAVPKTNGRHDAKLQAIMLEIAELAKTEA